MSQKPFSFRLALRLLSLFVLGAGLSGQEQTKTPPKALELMDGDRVALVGDTLMEREQEYGYFETRLHTRFPGKKFLVRNLGWSGDTPAGISRSSFDFADPAKGRQRLIDQLSALKPTVVFVGYGMASSFDGETGLPRFKSDVKNLLAEIGKISGDKVRIVLLGPIRHEKLPAPMPDPSAHNEQLKLYNDAIREIAREQTALFITLFDRIGDGGRDVPPRFFTDDGIHLTAFGYTRLADAVEAGLGWFPNTWRAGILKDGQLRNGHLGIEVTNIQRTAENVRFAAQEDRLVNPQATELDRPLPGLAPLPQLQCPDLAPGQYALAIDGRVVLIESSTNWARGVDFFPSPSFDQAEELRLAVMEKNKLFFNRWRPENETYLFGFRKNEQGKNAAEIPMFDPLIQQAEEKIRELAIPKSHVYELGSVAPGTTVRHITKVPVVEQRLDAPSQPVPEFDVAEGFEVNLFAEDPQLAKPIQMNFDSVGRLWVASSSVYPQIQPGQKANDKILILQDLDGDGKADKSTVFADGLLIPTGVVPGDGGCYVGQSTELLFFKAPLLGGKAVSRRVVLSGFGTEDTHHIVHTLRWGHDGQLYFNQSIYIHSHLETPHGVVRLNSGGIFHLRPSTMELGVFLKGFCNPWGHAIDEFGQSFETDGAGFQGVSYGIPGATYFTYAEMRREMKSVSPGNYPKFAGLEMISSEHFPADWQGNLVTCDFRAHRVVRFGLAEQGGGYVTREMPDLLRTTNVNFRPIDVKMGPDGALYIADWSNPIIQHGEVDFRDPRRDHEHGRIWRVTAKNRPLNQRKNFVTLQTPALLDELLSPNSFNRDQARRTLTERGSSIQPVLEAWTRQQTGEKAMLEALWMYQSLDIVEPALLEKMLEAGDGHVRAAAVRVLSFWQNRVTNPAELLARRVKDPFPRARIEAVRGLAKIPTATSAGLVLSVLGQPMDPFIDYAAWLSINDLAQPWIAALQSGDWKMDGRENQLEFGLNSIEPSLAGVVLKKILSDKTVSRLDQGPWIELIGRSGGTNELQQLFNQVRQGGFDESASVRALKAMGEAARLRKLKPDAMGAPVEELLANKNSNIQIESIRLAGTWKSARSVSPLVKLGGNSATRPEVREAAIQSLREIGGAVAVAGLRQLAGKEFDPDTRRSAVAALASINLTPEVPQIIEILQSPATEIEALKFWRALLGIKGAGPVLARNIKSLPEEMARAGLRVAREGGRREEQLELALSRAARIDEDNLGPTDAEIQQLAKLAGQKGDPARGETIYRRSELGCVNCHAIGGAGGKVGPDLTSVGASAPPDYLVESIYYPNRKIKEGFHSLVVQTKDEQEFSGLLVRENNEELILRDVTNKEISIPKNKIQSRNTGLSLMPSGLVDALPEGERLDLYRFLVELGKPGSFDASKGGVARAWKLRPGTHTVEQFGEQKFLTADFGGRDWAPVYSRVNGELPAEDLKAGLAWNNLSQFTSLVALYAATTFQVSKNGPATFDLECSSKRPAVFIDGKSVGNSSPIKMDLSAGLHVIVIKLDPRQLPDAIRLKSGDVSFLAN